VRKKECPGCGPGQTVCIGGPVNGTPLFHSTGVPFTRDQDTTSPSAPQASAPPPTNRGVRCTLDWLEFSSDSISPSYDLIPFITSDDYVESVGAYGYRRGLRCGHVAILCDGSEGMGTHYVISGQGCRELEARGLRDWSGYLRYLIDAGARITRLDVALDDDAGLLTVDRLRAAVVAGEVTRLSRRWRYVEDDLGGQTLYLGSRESDVSLCCYDKTAERQASAGGAVGSGSTGVVGCRVTRLELRTRHERAHALAVRLSESQAWGVLVAGVIRAYCEVRQPTADTNRRRWPVADWWLQFLGAVERVRLTLAPAMRTVETVRSWIARQVAPSLALVTIAEQGSVDWLISLVSDARSRLRPRHMQLLGGALCPV